MAVGANGLYVSGTWKNFTGLVRMYDFNGNLLWTSHFGGTSQLPGGSTSVSEDTRGVYVSGFNHIGPPYVFDILLRKYDFSGNPAWTDDVGNSTIQGADVHVGPTQIYLTGSLSNLGFLSSYESNGTLAWTHQFACNCVPSSVSTDSTNIYVSGLGSGTVSLSKFDWNGGILWTKDIAAPDLTGIDDVHMSVDQSGIYFAMTTVRSGFLMRYDTNGSQAWSVQIHRRLNAISLAQSGVYVGGDDGFSQGPLNAFVTEFSQSSSLVLFGVNPPFSFAIVGVLGGAVALSIFWLRRQRKRQIRRPKSAVPYSSPKTGEDDSKWMKRQP
jgi:hypothetical protein